MKRLSLIVILCSMMLQLLPVVIVNAANDVFDINSEKDLLDVVAMSQSYDFSGKTINLNTDITVTGSYSGNDSLTFSKDQDVPFKGTFNGNGHTIYNLNHHSTINYETCTGLFGYTDGAYIHDVNIRDSYIGADSLGGTLIGRALNTRIENILVDNTTVSVKCADNVITLITDGGLVGGGLVGVLDHSVMYNCTASNMDIVDNATEVAEAAAGKGLYLGGLVGDAQASTIEYSRVINNTRVKNSYDVVAGVADGNALYVGGIVGEMRVGTKVIDCFSTANLQFYCATYVSVAGGNAGHIGGIAGAAYGHDDIVIRSHFAGTATSTQYNAVLVIPIVQRDVNIYGLIDKNGSENIENSYYMSSTANAKGALGDGSVTDNSGPLSDVTYASRYFFEENGYDVVGNISRDTAYSSDHINKWVMYHDDTNNKIYPIHGISFMAGFDYPESSTVTINPNSINSMSDTTDDESRFASQIVDPGNPQSITVTPSSGYRLYGWYRTSANSTRATREYYDELFMNNSVVSNETTYTFSDTVDKDLFIARMQANVTFHDFEGNVIDRSGSNDTITNDNYYFYKEVLPNFEPTNRPIDENERFIGWTTVEGSHLSITNSELESYKANNQFYEGSEEVTKPLNLYPIYASLISNIHLIYEGNELDGVDDASMREGYGRAYATIDENNVATLYVEKTYPDETHYRFKGWYEDGHRISRDEVCVLEDVNLAEEHTYTARFEYLVDYYVRNTHTDTNTNSYRQGALYESVWHKYGEELTQLAAPSFITDSFVEWVLDAYDGSVSSVGHIVNKADDKVYSKYTSAANNLYTFSATTDFPNSATLVNNHDISRNFSITLTENPNYHFQFYSSEASYGNGISKQDIGNHNPYIGVNGNSNSLGQSVDSYYSYWYHARLLADVTFHEYDGSIQNVLRAYKENIFQNEGNIRAYTYKLNNNQISNEAIEALGADTHITASPNALVREGYYFAGWIDKDGLTSEEVNYVFDIDEYTSSSLAKALPYVLSDSDLVERAMPNIYAVYVPYNIITTTNIKEVGVIPPQNLPSDPTYTGLDYTSATSLLTFTIQDNSEYVVGDSGETYRLDRFTVSVNGKDEEVIAGPYTYTVKAGNTYVFKAYYEPNIVNFHINETDVVTFIRNKGQSINKNNEVMPDPTFNLEALEATTGNKYLFVGYTESESPTIYHALSSKDELVNYEIIDGDTIVNHSMDLYPVYVAISVYVNSNVDTILASQVDLNTIRHIEHTAKDEITLVANTNLQSYEFKGWYINYVDDNNLGNCVGNSATIILDDSNAFEGMTYTAVYVPIININYHGIDEERSIIYTASCTPGTRSFIYDTQEYIDAEGNTITIDGAAIDGEAFERIINSLNASQSFVEWVYVDNENNIHRWNEFASTLITQPMDLYPVIKEVKTYESPKDLDGNSVLKAETNILNTKLVNTQVEDETVYSVIASFKDEYYEVENEVIINRNELVPEVTISLNEAIYTPDKEVSPITNTNVKLYREDGGELLEEKVTDNNGEAGFPLYGTLTITTTGNDGDDFIFTILREDDVEAKKLIRISLRNNESKTIILPYGKYIVREDNDYAWRYSAQVEKDNLIISNLRNANAEFTNERSNNKWFDFNERRVNKYD